MRLPWQGLADLTARLAIRCLPLCVDSMCEDCVRGSWIQAHSTLSSCLLVYYDRDTQAQHISHHLPLPRRAAVLLALPSQTFTACARHYIYSHVAFLWSTGLFQKLFVQLLIPGGDRHAIQNICLMSIFFSVCKLFGTDQQAFQHGSDKC